MASGGLKKGQVRGNPLNKVKETVATAKKTTRLIRPLMKIRASESAAGQLKNIADIMSPKKLPNAPGPVTIYKGPALTKILSMGSKKFTPVKVAQTTYKALQAVKRVVNQNKNMVTAPGSKGSTVPAAKLDKFGFSLAERVARAKAESYKYKTGTTTVNVTKGTLEKVVTNKLPNQNVYSVEVARKLNSRMTPTPVKLKINTNKTQARLNQLTSTVAKKDRLRKK